MTYSSISNAIDLPLNRSLKIALSALLAMSVAACGSDSNNSETAESNDTIINDAQSDSDNNQNNGSGQTIPGATSRTVIGDVLSFGDDSKTLYVFLNDVEGVSNCNGGCATIWPAVQAEFEVAEGEYSTIEREDGTLQWSYNGQALYFYTGDAAEGDVNGEGINDVWFVARDVPVEIADSSLGEILVAKGSTRTASEDSTVRNEFEGRALYVFANDTADTSNCDIGCTQNWPPLYVDTAPLVGEDYSVITRSDGSQQWAYKTQPLYYYAGDSAAGDTTGEGIGDVWFAARP